MVGDPAQTIYSFTGATPEHLLGFPRRFPRAEVVRLVRNYRSTPQIVGLANLVLRSAARSSTGPAAGSYVELQAQGEPGPPPSLSEHPDDPAEAHAVASEIARLVGGGRPASEIAVLFRTNGQSESFESALAAAGVPYLVRGGERFFARTEVKQALLLLRGAARSDDGSKALPDLVRDVLGGAGWSITPPSSGGAVRERWESLNALATLADDLVGATPQARLPELVRELDERASAQHAPAVQGVTLASLHAAKGLEWDVVFLVGCSDGLMPISMAEGAAAIEEERRLLYVGMTRARSDLRLSWAASRTPGGRGTRRPSRFLDATASVLGAGARSTPKKAPGSGRAPKASTATRPPTCRGCGVELTSAAQRKVGRCESCPPTYDEATYGALRTWRLAVARTQSVPAYVVFTDATLTAIAEARPATLTELTRIAGVGARKLDLHGGAVLEVLAGGDPEQIAEKHTATTESADATPS